MNQPAIVKPCCEKVFQQNNIYCRFDANEVPSFSPQMLSSDYWQQAGAIVGSAQGRGTTWFIDPRKRDHSASQWVLRHYYRGGLIGKLIKDQYLFTGFDKTRAVREFSLLHTLQSLGLPAPKPIALRVVKHSLFYRADLLSSRIEDAKDLVAILSEHPLDETMWHTIGAVIKRFHQHGIYHHDLNAHNILIDQQQQVWLIDFDRGEQRDHLNKWPAQNIARLLRSFHKELNKLDNFHWNEKNWQALLHGYQSK